MLIAMVCSYWFLIVGPNSCATVMNIHESHRIIWMDLTATMISWSAYSKGEVANYTGPNIKSKYFEVKTANYIHKMTEQLIVSPMSQHTPIHTDLTVQFIVIADRKDKHCMDTVYYISDEVVSLVLLILVI